MTPTSPRDPAAPNSGAAPIPANESERLAELERYKLLDTLPEQSIDDIACLAAQICGTPMSLVSLVDRDRQWFKSKRGLEASETPRSLAFCAHAILEPEEILVVPDTHADPRFANNDLVTGPPHLRFYAGKPLVTSNGYALGTLCVLDTQPLHLSDEQLAALAALGRQTVDRFEARRTLQELKRTQVQAVQNAKMAALGKLVSGVAHEINNPIGFIGSNLPHILEYIESTLEALSLYRAALPEPPPEFSQRLKELDLDYIVTDLPKVVGSIEVGVWRISEIVDALKAFVRNNEAERKEIDLNATLKNPLLSLESRLAATETRARISITRKYGKLPPLFCCPATINQALFNLIDNAIEAIDALLDRGEDRPGHIEIETAADADRIYLSISDNGIGIAPKNADRIFEPFFTTKRLGLGSGLGLASCYAIVTEQHGGTIVHHPGPEGGSRFEIALPIVAPDSSLHTKN
ncbi:MAG: ATP-binding protein [Geitlerinemataceae cyanobacterium]